MWDMSPAMSTRAPVLENRDRGKHIVKSPYVSERQYKVYPPCFRELMTWDERFEVKEVGGPKLEHAS